MTGTQMAGTSAETLGRIVGYLTAVPAWYLATSLDGRPHVRPFSFAAVEDGRIWFCTSRGKDVYEELHLNPYFELCSWQPGSPWMIVAGQAVFAEPSPALREDGYEHMLGLGEQHSSADDGLLVFFYIDEGTARICDITGHEDNFRL